MTIKLRRSRRRVKVPSKFGDTVCVLNEKINDQFTNTDGVWHNDDHEEIRGNSRVCGSKRESELENESNGEMLNGGNETNRAGNDSQQVRNEHTNTKETSSSIPNTVSPAPVQVNVQSQTVKAWIGSGDSSNSYARKLVHNDNEANKLIHIPTVLNEKG
ncbi:hypothetical protein Tco_0089263 [Tanacetum coccineum]